MPAPIRAQPITVQRGQTILNQTSLPVAAVPITATQTGAGKKDTRTWLEKNLGFDLNSALFFTVGLVLVLVGIAIIFKPEIQS